MAATSKTFRTLARLTGAAPYSAGLRVPRELTLAGLGQLVGFVSRIESAALAELRGVSPDRAHQVPAGAVVAGRNDACAGRTVRPDLPVGAAGGCHPAQAGLVGRIVMAEPDWNPDTAGRSLAEILREANIESATRAARRRSWDDPEETGIRQRRAEAAAADRAAGFGTAQERPGRRAPAPRPARLLPSRARAAHRGRSRACGPTGKPGVPAATGDVGGDRDLGAGRDRRAAPRRRDRRAPADSAPQRAASQRAAPAGRRAARSGPPRRRAAQRAARRVADHPGHRARSPSCGPAGSTSRTSTTADDLDATPQESALAWLRFAGELVIALAAGVGVYFAATVLWETIPHVAALLAPLAVTGLVGGVGVWRHRQGREPVGPRLLATLVFAGTLLTIFPAAELLSRGS